MSEEKESIEQILKEFQAQKERRETEDTPCAFQELEPPKRYNREAIDFSKPQEQPAPTPENPEEKPKKVKKAKKAKPKKERKKPDLKKAVKPTAIALAAILALFAISTGVKFAVQSSKTAYLKPYQRQYENVEFPSGILEEYCDIYGTNPDTAGVIKISDINLDAPVSTDKNNVLHLEPSEKGYEIFNYVVYFNSNSLEELYKDADSYNNKASGFISYSNLIENYNFKVVGAFYTNTKSTDDNGYIFPYNVTENMTNDSFRQFIDRLQSRFIYDTGITITRQDKLITVSCPTDYKEDFRFVVVGVMRDGTDDKPTALPKEEIHFPQVIYDEQGTKNPYALASQWYPTITITDNTGKEITKQHSKKDYK